MAADNFTLQCSGERGRVVDEGREGKFLREGGSEKGNGAQEGSVSRP